MELLRLTPGTGAVEVWCSAFWLLPGGLRGCEESSLVAALRRGALAGDDGFFIVVSSMMTTANWGVA